MIVSLRLLLLEGRDRAFLMVSTRNQDDEKQPSFCDFGKHHLVSLLLSIFFKRKNVEMVVNDFLMIPVAGYVEEWQSDVLLSPPAIFIGFIVPYRRYLYGTRM